VIAPLGYESRFETLGSKALSQKSSAGRAGNDGMR
jgi:hypothetical protein